MIYLDSSAIAKLIMAEAETAVLRDFLTGRELVSSVVAHVELTRAVLRRDAALRPLIDAALARLEFIELARHVVGRASRLEPASLRSLDAIHLASAMELEDELEAIVTYDARMLAAAGLLHLPAASPA